MKEQLKEFINDIESIETNYLDKKSVLEILRKILKQNA